MASKFTEIEYSDKSNYSYRENSAYGIDTY